MASSQLSRCGSSDQLRCKGCGINFLPKRPSRTTFCGRDCSYLWHSVQKRVVVRRNRSLCETCGTRFEGKTVRSRYCCDDCKRNGRAKTAKVKNESAHKPKQIACAECGFTFSPNYGDKRRRFCGKDCQGRASRRVRRQKERARLRSALIESVDPIAVFERDGWKCRECGRSTPRRLRGTYRASAPELDHVLPLSLGGDHSYRNVQCLCRACNSAKSNTPKGQLSLL